MSTTGTGFNTGFWTSACPQLSQSSCDRRVFKKLTKAPSGWMMLDVCDIWCWLAAPGHPWPVLPSEIHRISPACILDRIAEGKYEAEPGELEKEKARPPRKTVQKI